MARVHLLPNFMDRAGLTERHIVDDVANTQLQFIANDIDADTVYVCKNKSGKYYPLSFMFMRDGKFVRRMGKTTVLEY